MQIKTRVRYHLTPIRTATIKRTEHKRWQGCGVIKTPEHYWWECKMAQLLWKTQYCSSLKY